MKTTTQDKLYKLSDEIWSVFSKYGIKTKHINYVEKQINKIKTT